MEQKMNDSKGKEIKVQIMPLWEKCHPR